MFASLSAPAAAPAGGLVKAAVVTLLAAALAACSSSKQPAGPQVFAWLAPAPAPPVAVAQAELEFEDDGLPSQAPPLSNRPQDPDDPAAPWSPNYGRTMPGGEDAAGPAVVAEAPSATDGAVEGLPVPMSPEEAGIQLEPAVRRPVRPMMGRSLGTCDMGRPWTCPR